MQKTLLLIISLAILGNLAAIKTTNSFFSDQETKTNNILSAANDFGPGAPTPTPTLADHLVINEVYYKPDDVHKIANSESKSEWVEIYNPTSGSLPMTGWSITDNYYCNNLPGSISVPASGFAIITATDSASLKTKWPGIPAEVIFIQIPSEIGNGLANNDELILKDALCDSGNIIDHISWGSNTDAFTPSISPVAEGHSLERNPTGYDMDLASDFVDRSAPSPGS